MSGGGDEAENYGASSHGLRTVASDAHVMRDAVRAAAQQAAGVAARSRADAANLGIPCGRRCCCLIPVCVQRRARRPFFTESYTGPHWPGNVRYPTKRVFVAEPRRAFSAVSQDKRNKL
jgi:hypothetical protein